MAERRTPFYDNHVRLGAQLIKAGGDFMLPTTYSDPVEEHENTRTKLGIQDLSAMGNIDVKGPDAESLVNHVLVNDVIDMMPGQVRYSTMCREDGGVLDDLTVYKFENEYFMFVTGSGPRQKDMKWLIEHAKGIKAYITDITEAYGLSVIQGPQSREFLKTVVENAELESLKFFHFTKGTIHGTEVIISRTGYTGELGYEILVPAAEANGFFEKTLDLGKAFGMKPYGVLAMQSLRLEKAYALYGKDVNENYTPFHVGLDRYIKFEKEEFIGKEALLKVRDKGVNKRWVGLVLDSDKPAAVDDKVRVDDEIVGHVTYSNKGHSVDKMLAMAYIKTDHCQTGTPLSVEIDGNTIKATVVKTPFYDPENSRLRI